MDLDTIRSIQLLLRSLAFPRISVVRKCKFKSNRDRDRDTPDMMAHTRVEGRAPPGSVQPGELRRTGCDFDIFDADERRARARGLGLWFGDTGKDGEAATGVSDGRVGNEN
ncbi:hypothetical protein LZ554_004998 [Drepanopeziza brunnea f. sp. 'monogermtubi']|nr:hypothetical protein LZ554_004998 [Drepanopeziza brunnea f. sp. 'monogermtubi']